MNKKGAELTINVVVIAAIVLITAAVVISFYVSQSKTAEKGLFECESKRGICVSTKEECVNNKGTIFSTLKCPQPQVCCYKFT